MFVFDVVCEVWEVFGWWVIGAVLVWRVACELEYSVGILSISLMVLLEELWCWLWGMLSCGVVVVMDEVGMVLTCEMVEFV